MGNLTIKSHSRAQKTNRYVIIKIVTLLLILSQVNIVFASGDDKITETVKSYIQNIRSVAIEFKQRDTKGLEAVGVLIIDKPYKFRVNYFAPFPLLIVGNKNYVSVYDYEMETISRIGAKENIFNFLLVDQIKFDDQFEVLETSETSESYKMKIIHFESLRVSEIEFNKTTQSIQKMSIIEDDNIITLEFGETKSIKKVNNKLFIMQDPDVFGKPIYLDKQALEKNYQ